MKNFASLRRRFNLSRSSSFLGIKAQLLIHYIELLDRFTVLLFVGCLFRSSLHRLPLVWVIKYSLTSIYTYIYNILETNMSFQDGRHLRSPIPIVRSCDDVGWQRCLIITNNETVNFMCFKRRIVNAMWWSLLE